MNNIHMMSDAELNTHLEGITNAADGMYRQLDFFRTQKQTAYVEAQTDETVRLIEEQEHAIKMCAMEIFRREQELMGELMDDYMDSQRNL